MLENAASHTKDEQRYDHGGHCGSQHVAYVNKEGHARYAGSQNGGVGEGRNLVAKVGPTNYGTCHPPFLKAKGFANAHEGYANGGHSGP